MVRKGSDPVDPCELLHLLQHFEAIPAGTGQNDAICTTILLELAKNAAKCCSFYNTLRVGPG